MSTQAEHSSTPPSCAATSAPCTATSPAIPTATSTSSSGAPVAERLGYPADWLDAVPADALASFAGVGHMLDVAAIRPATRCSTSARARAPTPSSPPT